MKHFKVMQDILNIVKLRFVAVSDVLCTTIDSKVKWIKYNSGMYNREGRTMG